MALEACTMHLSTLPLNDCASHPNCGIRCHLMGSKVSTLITLFPQFGGPVYVWSIGFSYDSYTVLNRLPRGGSSPMYKSTSCSYPLDESLYLPRMPPNRNISKINASSGCKTSEAPGSSRQIPASLSLKISSILRFSIMMRPSAVIS